MLTIARRSPRCLWELAGHAATVLIACSLGCFAQEASVEEADPPTLTPTEVRLLERKAEAGDAGAAWELHGHYLLHMDDVTTARRWERIAFQLRYPQAILSYTSALTAGNDYGFLVPGTNRLVILRSLLDAAAAQDPDVSYYFATLLARGYFDQGRADVTNAVRYHRSAVRRGYVFSADELPVLLLLTDNTNRVEEAYYWCAWDTMTSPPGTHAGHEKWNLRFRLSAALPLGTLERVWKQLDVDREDIRSGRKQLYPQLFKWDTYQGAEAERVYRESAEAVDRAESEYRRRRRAGMPPGRGDEGFRFADDSDSAGLDPDRVRSPQTAKQSPPP